MNQEHLLEMLRARLPRDSILLESFLRYQAAHFDEDLGQSDPTLYDP